MTAKLTMMIFELENGKNKKKRLKRSFKIWLIVMLILVLDQLSKIVIFKAEVTGESREIIKGFLWVTPRLNRGAAFSFLAGSEASNFFFLLISFAMIPVLVYLANGVYRGAPATGFGLLLGGAISNSIDRIMEARAVRDFIDLGWWPVFNLADAAISIGVIILIIWSMFFAVKREKKT